MIMTNEELREFIDEYSLLILKVISSVLNKPHEKHIYTVAHKVIYGIVALIGIGAIIMLISYLSK